MKRKKKRKKSLAAAVELGQRGGRNAWAGKSAAERSAIMRERWEIRRARKKVQRAINPRGATT